MTLWNQETRMELVNFVQERKKGTTVKEAIKMFVDAKGPEYNEGTASTMYYLTLRNLSKGRSQTPSSKYSKEEETHMLTVLHFAREQGITKKDVARYFVKLLGRPIRGVEQKLDFLEADPKDIKIPSEAPGYALDAIEYIKEGRHLTDGGEVAEGVKTPPRERVKYEPLAPAEVEELDTLDALASLSRATERIEGVNADTLIKQLAILSNMAIHNADSGNMKNQLIALTRENKRLERDVENKKKEYESLKREVDELKSMLKEYDDFIASVKEQQEVVNFVVDELTNLRTIEQIGGLKDYMGKIKTEMDKFGNVIRSVDLWKEEYEKQMLENANVHLYQVATSLDPTGGV